jgi:DNA/RNA endonuclease YhcR with UshA esterase domain
MINIIIVFMLHVFAVSACGSKQKPIEVDKFPGNTADSLVRDSMVQVVEPDKASGFVGETLMVRGLVADVHRTEKVAYLNFSEKFPKNPFTAVIFAAKFELFGDITQYEGKTVEVTGKITEYKGKPQIVLDSPSQIRILE